MNTDRWMFVALLALPLLVVAWDLGIVGALVLIALWLLMRWLLTLKNLTTTSNGELHLDTIAASHFVEKVRWCLDRAEIPYTEHQNVGTVGAFFLGRTVPRLRTRTGSVETSIGNSSDILRYLHGRYALEEPQKRAFLAPTLERVEWENKLDRYGIKLQIWVYYHMLKRPESLSKVWGITDPSAPTAQRAFATVAAPLLRVLIARSFGITERSVESARAKIEALLTETEAVLAASDYLVGNQRSYVDYAFGGLSSLWLLPDTFGNGKSAGVQLTDDEFPPSLLEDANKWREQFPATTLFLENLYKNERSSAPSETHS